MYQNRFCTKCGAELINGACPNCSEAQQAVQYQQPMAEYQQPQVQYQEQNYQSQQQPFVEVDPNDERFKSFFMNPKEKFVCALGNGYLLNFLAHRSLNTGFAVVSDKRVYFKGKAYEIGMGKLKSKSVSSTVDLKDVTGTEAITYNPIGIKVLSIITSILGLLMFLVSFLIDNNSSKRSVEILAGVMGWTGLFLLLVAVTAFCIYYAQSMTVLTIMFGGGGIAFPLNWYPAHEGEIFQKKLRIAKDQAVAEAENAAANAVREAMAVSAQPVQQSAVSAADELAKYAQLYKDGLLSEEEFAEIKAKLLTKQ